MSHILLDENTIAPAAPAAGKSIMYPKADGLWYSKDDAGVETLLTIPSLPLSVPDGGTGVATFTDKGVLFGSAASTIGVTAVGDEGEILTSYGGPPLSPAFGPRTRAGSEVSSATPTINTDSYDAYSVTALATAITSMTTNLSGTPTNFRKLIIRIKDNGTPRAITWGSAFEAAGVALPTTTVANKRLTVGFLYDTVTSKFGCVASALEV